MFLQELTWQASCDHYRDNIVAVIPVGSICQHGPGCPVGADFIIPTKLVKQLNEMCPKDILALPTIPFGVAEPFEDMCGTVNAGYEALYQYVSSVTASLMRHGIKRFLFHNGNEYNNSVLERVSMDIANKGGIGVVMNWQSVISDMKSDWGGTHGGAKEIAVMMYLKPEWQVSKEFTPTSLKSLPGLKVLGPQKVIYQDAQLIWCRPMNEISDDGFIKGPDYEIGRANDKWGKRMCETVTGFTANLIEKISSIEI